MANAATAHPKLWCGAVESTVAIGRLESSYAAAHNCLIADEKCAINKGESGHLGYGLKGQAANQSMFQMLDQAFEI